MNIKKLDNIFLQLLRKRRKESTKAQQVLNYINIACKLHNMDRKDFAKEVLGTTTQSLRNYERYEAGERGLNCVKLEDAKAQSFIEKIGVYGVENDR